jgi:hypothetical protein
MTRPSGWFRRHRALIAVNAAIVLAVLGAWAAYRRWGHALIQAIYDGAAGPLNNMIKGQDIFPVQRYLDLADGMLPMVLAGAVLIALLLETLALSLRGLRGALTAPQPPPSRPGAHLFVVSFLILFLELAAIRWFPAHVVFLTFFANFVLMAAFVGMSVGCLAARRKAHLVQLVPPLLLASVMAAGLVQVFVRFLRLFTVRIGNPTDPEHVFFGTVFQAREAAGLLVPIEAIISVFFVILGVLFVGLGQELGRGLTRVPNRVTAYTINIAGSLAGIAGFTLMSRCSIGPTWWFLIAFAGLLWLLRGRTPRLGVTAAALGVCLAVIGAMDWAPARLLHLASHWSPYYNIRYQAANRAIFANGVGQQQMTDRAQGGIAYSLPYLLSRDSGRPPIQDVLIVGAGSGNDASHALWHGAARVDAVEIDPIVAALGRRDHPNRPYDDPRVNLIVSDGRHVLRNAPRKYDLIVYALVDSLALHSCYSSVRLESFLFTREAMEDVKTHLKENGIFAVYNQFRQGWVATRLTSLVGSVFDQEPLVISLPSLEVIRDTDTSRAMTMVLAGGIAPIREQFAAAGAYALDIQDFSRNLTQNGFATAADTQGPELERIFPARVETARPAVMPTDDWPFFYLQSRRIPWHNVLGLATVIGLSLAMLLVCAPARSVRVNPHFLFLGAGFMLVETNSVIRLALLFGSTWLVNALVFFSILVMILLANLFVLWRKPQDLRWPSAGLLASVALNLVANLDTFLGLPGGLRVLASCVVVFLPILFAGVIFAISFGRSRDPDLDFGANIAGAVLGGILEYVALVTGYRLVLVLVLALYALSLLGLRRRAEPSSAAPPAGGPAPIPVPAVAD